MSRHLVAGTVTTLFLCIAGLSAARGDVADAVMNGDKAAFRALLQKRADVNVPQVDGSTALHWAVYRDDVEATDLLIRAGANVNAANRNGITPLAMASLYGNVSLIERLLRAGADAGERGPNGQTVLMLAARNGNPRAIELLLAGGASINARETLRGTTALMWAAEQRHPAAVKALLDGGADVSLRSGGAGLPRNYMAPRVRVENVEAAAARHRRALAAGRTYAEQLSVERVGGRFGRGGDAGGGQAATPQPTGTPAAVQPAQPPAAAQPSQPQAAGQRGRGRAGRGNQSQESQTSRRPASPGGLPQVPDPDDVDDDNEVIIAGLVGTGGGGLTALIFAAREGDQESAKLLLDAGADVNQTSEYGWTPLLTATNNRHYKLASYLIERGADVNLANKGGWTPLYLATDNRNIEGGDYPVPRPDIDHLDFIKVLLEHRADPNARAKDNTLSRTIFTMQWFFEAGATPFVRAAQSSDTALMTLLLQYGADPKIPTDHGDTALTAAAGIGWVEGVTYERSAKENVEAIRMLLDLGLDPNAANNDGRTALMAAASKGRNEVVQLLVDRGARLDQRDRGSRDTDTVVSQLAGHTWQAIDYADGLVRVGVQSAVNRPETAALLRKLMTERGLPVPPPNRVVESICIVEICKERQP
jgi:ankyrin repeat protein